MSENPANSNRVPNGIIGQDDDFRKKVFKECETFDLKTALSEHCKTQKDIMIDKLESLYTERAIIEKSVEQYGAWMETEGYAKLDQQEQDIIDKQFSFMNGYLHCLNQRIQLEVNFRMLPL